MKKKIWSIALALAGIFMAATFNVAGPAQTPADRVGFQFLDRLVALLARAATLGPGGGNLSQDVVVLAKDLKSAQAAKLVDDIFAVRYGRLLSVVRQALLRDPEVLYWPMYRFTLAGFIEERTGRMPDWDNLLFVVNDHGGSGVGLAVISDAVMSEVVSLHLHLETHSRRPEILQGYMDRSFKAVIEGNNPFTGPEGPDQLERGLDIAGVQPGMVVGEVGAGSGYFTFKLARRIGPTGKVYANDIREEKALATLRALAKAQGLANIETILGSEADPLLPRGLLELVFLVNTFHDLGRPVELLGNLVSSLKPGAKVIVVDGEAETPEPPKKSPGDERYYTRQEFLDLIAQSPFQVERVDTSLPKHVLFILGGK